MLTINARRSPNDIMSATQIAFSRSKRIRHAVGTLRASFALFIVLGVSLFSRAQKPKEVSVSIKKFDWSIDTRVLGFVDDPILAKLPRVATFPAVQFISDSDIAVAFVTREAVSGLQKRDDPNRQLPFKLHEVVFESATGKEKTRRDFPNEDANIGFFSRPDGSAIVFSHDFLTLYSPDGHLAKQTSLTPKDNVSPELVGVDPSPSRNSLFVRYRVGKSLECDWFSVPSMTVSKGVCDLSFRMAISDQGMAIAAPVKDRPRDLQIQVQLAKQPWKILCDTKDVAGCGAPWFVDNRSMLIHTSHELDLLSTDGTVLMRREIFRARNEETTPDEVFSSAPNSHRIAVTISRREGVSNGIVIDWSYAFFHAGVYDTDSQSWVFSVDNDTRPDPLGNGRDPHPFTKLDGIALSPNGKQLVIEIDGKILSYSLPL